MDGPIPGQSLTREPKNAVMERPPEIADPNEAVEYYLEKIADPETLDNILHTLEVGMPVKILVEAMLTTGVAGGIHSIDVSLAIADVVQEYQMISQMSDMVSENIAADNETPSGTPEGAEEAEAPKEKPAGLMSRRTDK